MSIPAGLSELELGEYREAFDSFDTDSSGRIDVEELGNAMRLIGLNPTTSRITDLIKEVDYNNDGEIDFPEFCHCLTKLTAEEEEAEEAGEHDTVARACFEVFDQNRDGIITEEEFRFVMRELGEFSDSFAERIYREVDVTGNGTIDYDEFYQFVRDYLFDDEKK